MHTMAAHYITSATKHPPHTQHAEHPDGSLGALPAKGGSSIMEMGRRGELL